MSCILRVSGEFLDIDAMLSQHKLSPYRTWKKGEARSLKGEVHSDCGASFIASEADFDEFDCQVTDATTYLELHVSAIARMAATTGVQFAVLDFGVFLNEGDVVQFCYFPPRLIQLAASAGIGIEVSQYVGSKDGSDG